MTTNRNPGAHRKPSRLRLAWLRASAAVADWWARLRARRNRTDEVLTLDWLARLRQRHLSPHTRAQVQLTVAGAVVRELQALSQPPAAVLPDEDDERYPWLSSGQYSDDTDQFARDMGMKK